MVKDQAQIEQVSELERWFATECNNQFINIWSYLVKPNTSVQHFCENNEKNTALINSIHEILNKEVIAISDLEDNLRKLIELILTITSLSFKANTISYIRQSLSSTYQQIEIYTMHDKKVYSDIDIYDIQTKMQDFFSFQFAAFIGFLKSLDRELSHLEIDDENEIIFKKAQIILIRKNLKEIEDIKNSYKKLVRDEFMFNQTTKRDTKKLGSEEFVDIYLLKAFQDYLEIGNKGVIIGGYGQKKDLIINGETYKFDDTLQAFQRLSKQRKGKDLKAKFKAFADMYQKKVYCYHENYAKGLENKIQRSISANAGPNKFIPILLKELKNKI
jgi:hypothetical protein